MITMFVLICVMSGCQKIGKDERKIIRNYVSAFDALTNQLFPHPLSSDIYLAYRAAIRELDELPDTIEVRELKNAIAIYNGLYIMSEMYYNSAERYNPGTKGYQENRVKFEVENKKLRRAEFVVLTHCEKLLSTK